MRMVKPRWADRRLPRFFVEWRASWGETAVETFVPVDYLNQQEGSAFSIMAAWLFCPEVVEYRGCLFLAWRFDRENVDMWFGHFGKAPDRVEAMVNQVKLYDVFGNSDLGDTEDDLDQLAEAIGECWQGVLSGRYPERDITVEISGDEDGSYGPTVTFWSEPGSLRSGEVAAALGG
jgi:hypothetical protein